MNIESLKTISEQQKKRLAHIDFRLNFLGSINRRNLLDRFGIKNAAATRDLALYREIADGNAEFNDKLKIYERSNSFKPVFQYTASQVLTALTEGFGEDLTNPHSALIPCETPTRLNLPSIDDISVLSRAINLGKAVEITYRSVSSGITKREIVPFAIIDNGIRWHIRAYDRKRGQFADFVLTRLSHPKLTNSLIENRELRENDNQWNRIVEMVLAPHPRLKYPETIEHDYGMESGVLVVSVRAALAGYVLRRLNVDCSKSRDLEGPEYHLYLKNVETLYGVENLKIAPGYNFEEVK